MTKSKALDNISTSYKYNELDSKLISGLLSIIPEKQVEYFKSIANQLSDYAYWFLLSTLWVDNSTIASVSEWKQLFKEKRPSRQISFMKPDELAKFKALPNKLFLYRAHSKNEEDWISYTLDIKTATEFATRKNVNEIVEYKTKKSNCLALLLRREESEIICLDKKMVKKKRIIKINGG